MNEKHDRNTKLILVCRRFVVQQRAT